MLERLSELKVVVRLGRRIGGVRAGSAGFVYGLSGYGQAVLKVDGPTGKRRRRVWETSPPHQRHVLAVSELYVQMVEASRSGVRAVELVAFIEVDMGTESSPTIAKKCQAYISYWRGSIEQGAHDVFPVVLWLTEATRRAEQLAGVVRRLPHEAQALFRVALLSDAVGLFASEEGKQ